MHILKFNIVVYVSYPVTVYSTKRNPSDRFQQKHHADTLFSASIFNKKILNLIIVMVIIIVMNTDNTDSFGKHLNHTTKTPNDPILIICDQVNTV